MAPADDLRRLVTFVLLPRGKTAAKTPSGTVLSLPQPRQVDISATEIRHRVKSVCRSIISSPLRSRPISSARALSFVVSSCQKKVSPRRRNRTDDSGLDLARQCVWAAQEKKAHDPIILDLRNISTITDYLVICSAQSEPQIKAIATAWSRR